MLGSYFPVDRRYGRVLARGGWGVAPETSSLLITDFCCHNLFTNAGILIHTDATYIFTVRKSSLM